MGVVQPEIKPQQGKCYMLAYNQGYANLSSVHYLAVKNTANKGACCNLCLRDSRCVAWTRVAGEDFLFSHAHMQWDGLQVHQSSEAFLRTDWPWLLYTWSPIRCSIVA